MKDVLIHTRDALLRRNFDAYTVESADEACALILSWIEKTESVTWGGSATVAEIGLVSALKEGGYLVYDREKLLEIYETGKGSVTLRSKYSYDPVENCIDICS